MGNRKTKKGSGKKYSGKKAASATPCPPGLQHLNAVGKLIVEQEVDMMDVFTGWESSNRYSVRSGGGHLMFYAVEQSDVFTMNMMGSARPFDILVMDQMRVAVLRVRRPFQLEGCGCCGCVQEIEVTSGVGHLLGGVVEVWSCCGKKFDINDSHGNTVLKIEGPACVCPCSDTDFNVMTPDGSSTIGVITRRYPGFFKAAATHADVYAVEFPKDLDVKMKATLLGATFLIDFMYFEKKMQDTNFNKSRDGDESFGQFGGGFR